MNHEVNMDVLVSYALGELDHESRARLEKHLAASPEAAQALHRVQQMLGTLHSGDLRDLPPALHQRLRSLFTPQGKPTPSWIENAAQAVLTLLLDTRLAPARGFRSFTDEAFLLTFAGPDINVDLQCTPAEAPAAVAPRRWTLRGCAETDGHTRTAQVALLAPDRHDTLVTRTDEYGQFSINVTEGACTLALSTGERAFTTPTFHIP